jgi:hypothetical protein
MESRLSLKNLDPPPDVGYAPRPGREALARSTLHDTLSVPRTSAVAAELVTAAQSISAISISAKNWTFSSVFAPSHDGDLDGIDDRQDGVRERRFGDRGRSLPGSLDAIMAGT